MPMTAMELVAAAKQQIRETTPAESHPQLGSYQLLDVREPAEFAAGRIPGAINIPRGVLEFQIGNQPAFRPDAPILVYCLSGGRSALAAENLQKMGYTQVVSLAGGYKAWSEAGLPTEA